MVCKSEVQPFDVLLAMNTYFSRCIIITAIHIYCNLVYLSEDIITRSNDDSIKYKNKSINIQLLV